MAFDIDTVAENAAKPASADISPGRESVSQHPLRDQIEVAKLKGAQDAFANTPEGCIPGIQSYVINPPGAF